MACGAQRLNFPRAHIKRRERISVSQTPDEHLPNIYNPGDESFTRDNYILDFYRKQETFYINRGASVYFIVTVLSDMALSFRRRCLLLLCLTALQSGHAAVQVRAM